MSSTIADLFFKDQFHGRDGEDLGPFVNNRNANQDPSPMNQRVTASITPESLQSYHNMSQERQLAESTNKEGGLLESPFDFSDYDESINFGVAPVSQEQPQQQQNQQRDPASGAVFDASESAVKSEYSPIFPISVTPSASQSSSSATKNEFVDFLNDELVRDESGMSMGSVEMHETSCKVGKKRKEKISHNIIEKKYRTNINDKIFQLREIVPTLRFAHKNCRGMPILAQDAEDLDGLEPARKLNKVSILMKTIEYIQHLESKCAAYRFENQQLKDNIPRQDNLYQQTTAPTAALAAAAPAIIPGSQRATNNSNTIPSHIAGQFHGQFYGSPTYSEAPPSSSRQQDAVPNNNSYYNSDYASKILMGGMALTMGATCFGENGGDMGAARALFAMPVFRFSAQNGFVILNSYGTIDLQSSIFSLLRLSLVLITGVYLLNCLLFAGKNSGKKHDSETSSIFATKDTVQFDSIDHLKQTLWKTLVINRLKYRLNSMERIESKIAKCFAIRVYFQKSSLPWSAFSEKYVDKLWKGLRNQINAANVKSKGLLRMGLEWDMITNITTVGREMTLDNSKLLKVLSSDEKEYDLKEFISLLNSYILKEQTEDMLSSLLEKLVSSDFNKWNGIIGSFRGDEFRHNEILKSIPEKYLALDCLLRPDKESCDKLSKWIRANKEETLEDLLNEKLVLYGSIVRRLIELKQYDQCEKLLKRMPLQVLEIWRNSISMVGFTSMYLMLNSVFENISSFRQHSMMLETACGEVRVWLGSSPGDIVNFSLRSRMIAYCIEKSLLCDSLTQFDDDTEELDDDKLDGESIDKDDDTTDFEE
ncbi:hypothetical protein HG536_0A06460 [Torulaspora globosa]|uniref:BHLH domain-containing protein n=1 Tax=Torulaspora globosa TaxID=48254 RepID=A0A7G3ZBE5_9SACH|nr:uncharacterized protein HG536_0A06460 [Torulaspora globosa]QLL30831.1 hypothetical protein HG536_0A06460 [Torulaspora globosa]